MKEWMSINDLSDYLQITQISIRHLIKQKRIPFHDRLGTPRFFKSEIDDWMRTPISIDQLYKDKEVFFIYRDKPIKEFVLTASKILIGQTAWNRLPNFIKQSLKACKELNRPFLYRREFEPLMKNFNDYLRISCQLGLIDNKKGWEREKHYYPTKYSERIYIENSNKEIKKIILGSMLDLVKRNMENFPQERHANYLLWFLLKIKDKGLEPEENHFNKGGETNYYPKIRLNFSLSFCDFLFGKDRSKEQTFLASWDEYIKTKSY